MLTREELLNTRCRPLEGGRAMSSAEVNAQLRALPEWALVDGALERTYAFDDYYRTIAFVNALAYMVHHEDHHPDLIVGYNRCRVRFNTHSVGGVSVNDFICAAKADAIRALRFGPDRSA
jgi:4a-hydroxytetrahydrobiopterin dehydratase